MNSPHHTIDIYKAAISAVHLSLISLAFFPTFSSRSSKLTTNGTANGNGYAKKTQPVRFGSETDRWGNELVGCTPVIEWEEHEEQGRELLGKCDELYQQFLETETTADDNPTDSKNFSQPQQSTNSLLDLSQHILGLTLAPHKLGDRPQDESHTLSSVTFFTPTISNSKSAFNSLCTIHSYCIVSSVCEC